MISCYCDYDVDDASWYISAPVVGRSELRRACSCKSCGARIEPEALCSIAYRHRPPKDNVEMNIFGEDGEISIAPYRYCLECGSALQFIFDMNGCADYDKDFFHQLEDFVESGGCDDEEKLYQSVLRGFSEWLFLDESDLLDYDICLDKAKEANISPEVYRIVDLLKISFREANKMIAYGMETGLLKIGQYNRPVWVV